MTHVLKVWKEFYPSIDNGDKTFELRKDDRDFKVGDKLILQEYDNHLFEYTGKECERRITYILKDASKFGLKRGFVILGLWEPIF